MVSEQTVLLRCVEHAGLLIFGLQRKDVEDLRTSRRAKIAYLIGNSIFNCLLCGKVKVMVMHRSPHLFRKFDVLSQNSLSPFIIQSQTLCNMFKVSRSSGMRILSGAMNHESGTRASLTMLRAQEGNYSGRGDLPYVVESQFNWQGAEEVV